MYYADGREGALDKAVRELHITEAGGVRQGSFEKVWSILSAGGHTQLKSSEACEGTNSVDCNDRRRNLDGFPLYSVTAVCPKGVEG